eukprot:6114343-Pyramimonas_sp.AAC.1
MTRSVVGEPKGCVGHCAVDVHTNAGKRANAVGILDPRQSAQHKVVCVVAPQLLSLILLHSTTKIGSCRC